MSDRIEQGRHRRLRQRRRRRPSDLAAERDERRKRDQETHRRRQPQAIPGARAITSQPRARAARTPQHHRRLPQVIQHLGDEGSGSWLLVLSQYRAELLLGFLDVVERQLAGAVRVRHLPLSSVHRIAAATRQFSVSLSLLSWRGIDASKILALFFDSLDTAAVPLSPQADKPASVHFVKAGRPFAGSPSCSSRTEQAPRIQRVSMMSSWSGLNFGRFIKRLQTRSI